MDSRGSIRYTLPPHLSTATAATQLDRSAALLLQKYFGTAVGKGRQAAKTEIERLNLMEMTCRQGVVEVAKM